MEDNKLIALRLDLSTYTQWDYTAADGSALLLAIGNKGNSYIFAEQKDAMLIVRINGNLSGSLYPNADEILTKEQLEAIADVFDYSARPQAADDEELYELVVYSGTNGHWMADWWNEQPLTDAEAEAILAKYPRIEQGMRPISELLN